MQKSPIPDDEENRLRALYRYNILDTGEEQDFNDLVYLASSICQTPIATITLVDKDRQWFKSKIGLDALQTPRDIGFCAHVINQKNLFIIPDALNDERFHDNPLVTGDLNVRFYVGAPLVTPDGQVIGSLCAIDNKPRALSAQQEQALKSLSRQVISQMELRTHMKDLRRANEQLLENQGLLTKAYLHKTVFLSNMSHEIRTPLNAILGFSQLLQLDAVDYGLPDHVKESLNHIEKSGKQLVSLVDNVLEISRIESNKIEVCYTDINLQELIDLVYQVNLVQAKDANINFTCSIKGDLPTAFTSDRPKLLQILMNVVGNAIKFTPTGGTVLLEIDGAQGQLVFRTQDTGIGIAKDNQQSIFNAFEQVDQSSSRGYEGIGLGLSITKSLVEFLDGHIEVQSQLNQGSVFSVSFPIVESISFSDEDNAYWANGEVGASTKKVLIVEDNPHNQNIMACFFEKTGLGFKFADNGHRAVDDARSYHPDLILMDIHLPGISGAEAAREIYNIPECQYTPIVALAAATYIAQENSNAVAGFMGCLAKPLKSKPLMAVLKKYLS